jgi:hypothetical protein
MIHVRFLRAAALAALASIPLAYSGTAGAAETCDRNCLAGMVTQYLDALVAHDPVKLPLAENARFVEDSKAVKLGDGIWKTATAKGPFRQDYLDTRKQVAATHAVVMEGQNPALCSIVLHLQDRKIIGVETLIQRITPDSRFQPTELGKPVRGMNDPVPAGKKQSRESMIKTALTYPEGLRVGSFIDGGTPFASETYRVENGVVTAGGGCGRGDCGMYAQNIMVHPSIIANVAAVDEENGVVLLWMNFGYTASYGEGSSLVTFEAFKVWGGQIHSINAFFRPLPVGTGRYWPSSDPLPR